MESRIGNYKIASVSKTEVKIIGPASLGMYIILIAISMMSAGTFYSAFWYEDLIVVIFEEIFAVLLSVMLFRSYFSLIYTNPGIIPKSEGDYSDSLSYKINLYYFMTKKLNSKTLPIKFCHTCKILRPPRSFHCRVWNVWVERHDHHWFFTGGCIGVRNHKKFVVFLLTTTFVSFSALWINAPIAYESYPRGLYGDMRDFDKFIISFFWCFIQFQTAFAMGLFALFHLYYASQNITSNEGFRKVYGKTGNPFDEGWRRNFRYFWKFYHRFPWHIRFMSLKSPQKYYNKLLSNYGEITSEKSSPLTMKNEMEDVTVGWIGKKYN